MRLEWFREHQGKVFWITAAMVIPGMLFYGASRRANVGPAGTGENSGVYMLNYPEGTERYIPGNEVFSRRVEWQTWFTRNGDRSGASVSTEDVAKHLAAIYTARELGFDIGKNELTDDMREEIKSITKTDAVNQTIIDTLMNNLQITQQQFERLTREYYSLGKYHESAQQAKVTDGSLYVQYATEKQKVRVLYQEFRSKDLKKDVPKFSADDIKKYYEKNKNAVLGDQDALFTEPLLAADVFFLPEAEIKKSIQPTEEQLKKSYDNGKAFFWKKEVPAGQKALEGDAAFKTYEEVKAEVRNRYIQDEVSSQNDLLYKKYNDELEAAEKKAADAKTKVDLAAFAKERGLQYWRTKSLNRRAFKAGQEKVGAEDFKLAVDLFYVAAPAEDPAQEKERAKDRAKLSTPRRIQALTEGEGGFAAMRTGDYVAAKQMTLEQATPIIEGRLITEKSYELARDAAKAAQEKWTKGDGIPAPETLKEEVFTDLKDNKNKLAQLIFEKLPAIGEILPYTMLPEVEAKPQEDPDPNTPLDVKFVVGFVVERTLPTYDQFLTDPVYDKVKNGDALRQVRLDYMQRESASFLNDLAKPHHENIPDPPLFGRQ